MRRKLYFMLPDVKQCKVLVAELQENGISNRHIHVVAADDIPLEGLHKASKLDKTELTYGLEWGIGIGGAAGLLGGLLAVAFPPAGVVLAGEAIILATTLVGAGFGSLVSALVAGDIPNHKLEKFRTAILDGHILLILDVPTSRVDTTIQLIESHHPEAEIGIVRPKKI